MLPARRDARSVTTHLTLPRWLDTKVELLKGDNFCSLVSSYVSGGRCRALSGCNKTWAKTAKTADTEYRWCQQGKDWLEKRMSTCTCLSIWTRITSEWYLNGFKRDSCKQCKASQNRDLKILYSLWKDFIKMSSSNSSNSHRMLKTNMQPS